MRRCSSERTRPFSGSTPMADRFRSAQRHLAADGQHHRLALDARAVGEVHDVAATGAGSARTPTARTPSRSVTPSRSRPAARYAELRGMLPVVDPVARVHDGHLHAVAGVDLRKLDAGRAATQDHETIGQLPRPGSLLVGPVLDLVEPGERRDLRVRADRDDHLARLDAHRIRAIAGDLQAPRRDEPSDAAEHGRAGIGQGLHVRSVVRIGMPSRLIIQSRKSLAFCQG